MDKKPSYGKWIFWAVVGIFVLILFCSLYGVFTG